MSTLKKNQAHAKKKLPFAQRTAVYKKSLKQLLVAHNITFIDKTVGLEVM
jgi:hypothetical protein